MKKQRQSFADIVRGERERSLGRVLAKVPEWSGIEGLCVPTALSTEQCSSSPTARYKASLVPAGVRLADLTGGLGVDSWAFSKVCGEVLYNEMDTCLHDAVKSNFEALGCANIKTSCSKLDPGGLGAVLWDFRPDVIFLDPARRASSGKKVFLLEDCSPDLIGLRDELLDAAPTVMVKVSPMADITMLATRLGPCLSEVHVVGSDGECKELLLVLRRGNSEPYGITVAECSCDSSLRFTPAEESASSITLPSPGISLEGLTLFEPGSALMKSGCHSLLCERFGLIKCARFTHLYLCEEVPTGLKPFGKSWKIMQQTSLDKRSLREAGRMYPHCEVTARNVPFTSEEMRAMMGASSGGSVHAFGITLDPSSRRALLICTRT